MSTLITTNVISVNTTTSLTLTAGNVALNSASLVFLANGSIYVTSNATQNALTIVNNKIGIYANNSWGTAGQYLATNGNTAYWTSAVLGFTTTNVQTFTVSGTWTKPVTGTYAKVQMWGGGAGGSTGANSINSTTVGVSLGGGGGAYSEYITLLSSLTPTVTVTVGAGGLGNTYVGDFYDILYGGSGGYTAFGTYANAYGGLGSGFGGNSVNGSFPAYTNTIFLNATVATPVLPVTPGMQTYQGGVAILTANTLTNGTNISVFGGGGGLLNIQSFSVSGNSVWGGGAGGGCFGNTSLNFSGTGGVSVFGGNGGFSGNSTTSTQVGFFPGGGGGSGLLVTGAATTNSLTAGANGGNGYCIVSVW